MLRRPPREESLADRILHLLKLYSSSWTGTLGRGDLIIPQRELPRFVRDLLNLLERAQGLPTEAAQADVFEVLMETRRLASVQDQLDALLHRFVIIDRSATGE